MKQKKRGKFVIYIVRKNFFYHAIVKQKKTKRCRLLLLMYCAVMFLSLSLSLAFFRSLGKLAARH